MLNASLCSNEVKAERNRRSSESLGMIGQPKFRGRRHTSYRRAHKLLHAFSLSLALNDLFLSRTSQKIESRLKTRLFC
jgi:hypothetical protein